MGKRWKILINDKTTRAHVLKRSHSMISFTMLSYVYYGGYGMQWQCYVMQYGLHAMLWFMLQKIRIALWWLVSWQRHKIEISAVIWLIYCRYAVKHYPVNQHLLHFEDPASTDFFRQPGMNMILILHFKNLFVFFTYNAFYFFCLKWCYSLSNPYYESQMKYKQ